MPLGAVPTSFPCVLGHEGSGVVISVGSAVTRVKTGDSVLMSFSYCTECVYCKSGRPAGCQQWFRQCFGRWRNDEVKDKAPFSSAETGEGIAGTFFGQSSFARHALVVESSCVVVPSTTDLVNLAPLGCGLQSGCVSRLFPHPSQRPLNPFFPAAPVPSSTFSGHLPPLPSSSSVSEQSVSALSGQRST